MLLGKPDNLANDKVVLRESINGNVGVFARLYIKHVHDHSRILCADLGVAKLQLIGVNRNIFSIIVDVVWDSECTNTSLVEAKESNLSAIGREP